MTNCLILASIFDFLRGLFALLGVLAFFSVMVGLLVLLLVVGIRSNIRSARSVQAEVDGEVPSGLQRPGVAPIHGSLPGARGSSARPAWISFVCLVLVVPVGILVLVGQWWVGRATAGIYGLAVLLGGAVVIAVLARAGEPARRGILKRRLERKRERDT